MINNTGYEDDHREVVKLTKKIYVSMFTEPSYHYTDDEGYVRTSKEPQQLWMNVAVFHRDMDFGIQYREFSEQADYFRYLAETKNRLEKYKEIEADSYACKGVVIKA